MPAPATAEEFIELIRKSGVVEEARVSAYVKQLQSTSNLPTDLSKLAGLFVRDGLLTFFQAEQFLLGKWKRFTIGKYKVLERLGSGGMGQVFLCEHKLMRRKVAVKVLPTAKAEDPSSLDRFYREARAVAALDHPNIVRAYDIDQDDNLHFLVMEYVDGASLQEIIKKTGPMDVSRACHYMYWSAIGLQHAHESGLIHRDIKPGNILVDRLGTVKILDMGLARFFNDDEDMLTKKYDENVLGTADYLAPEQALDSHGVDGRADIYSLGATFYFLLSGSQPFVDGTVAQKLIWHQTRKPKHLREVRSDIPEGVIAIVEKMMAKEASQRYQTPAELAEALAPWVQTPIEAPPEKEMPLISAAAAAIGGGTISTTPRPTPAVPRPASGSGSKQGGGSGVLIQSNERPSGSAKRGLTKSTPTLSKNSSQASNMEDTARRTEPTPIVESMPAETEHAVWESLAADTNDAAVDKTDRQAKPPRSKKLVKPIEEKPKPKPAPVRRVQKNSNSLLIIGLVAMVTVAAGVAVYWFFIRTPGKKEQPVVRSGDSSRLTVSKAGGQGQFTSVKDAWANAKENAHIVILDSPWEEEFRPPSGSASGVTIEGPGDKEIVWRSKSNQQVIYLQNTNALTIDGITFDGHGQAAYGIVVLGKANGLVLRNLVIKDVTMAGVKFVDCNRNENHVKVQKVRVLHSGSKVQAESGITFSASTPEGNAGIVIEDCRLEGSFRNGAFQVEGSVSKIDLKQNRIWQASSGVFFKDSKPAATYRMNISNNTFYSITDAAVRFKNANMLSQPSVNQAIELRLNYFFNVNLIVRSEDNFVGFTFRPAEENARNGATKEGNPSINATVQEGQLGANPDDDKTFLRYDKKSPLYKVPPHNKPVGAMPID